MSQPYVGEIRIVGFNFAPNGWALCDGALFPISQNSALFNLIGTTYGGDGQSTFAVPDLRGRAPMHQGLGNTLGLSSGQETATLAITQIPSHAHGWPATSAAANFHESVGNALATAGINVYATGEPTVALAANSVDNCGKSLPHENRMPYQVVNFIISLFGIYPSQN